MCYFKIHYFCSILIRLNGFDGFFQCSLISVCSKMKNNAEWGDCPSRSKMLCIQTMLTCLFPCARSIYFICDFGVVTFMLDAVFMVDTLLNVDGQGGDTSLNLSHL